MLACHQEMVLEKLKASSILNNAQKLKWSDVEAIHLETYQKLTYFEILNTSSSTFKDFMDVSCA